ncbi:MAG: transposase [bacterium]|nr:transposase [bacterium]MDE0600166.1 transposase [bacterium]
MSEGQVDVYGGVDTHRDVHVAAVVNSTGRVLGTASFAADQAGYEQLCDWLGSHGRVVRVGIEGTGSYGAGLTRRLTSIGVEVVEVNRANRQLRRIPPTGRSDLPGFAEIQVSLR